MMTLVEACNVLEMCSNVYPAKKWSQELLADIAVMQEEYTRGENANLAKIRGIALRYRWKQSRNKTEEGVLRMVRWYSKRIFECMSVYEV